MQTQLDLSAEASCRTVQVANYNHDMKEIMQEILYENTSKGMQKDPQLYNILVQSVCISFLKRKHHAAKNPRHKPIKDNSFLKLILNSQKLIYKTFLYKWSYQKTYIYSLDNGR